MLERYLGEFIINQTELTKTDKNIHKRGRYSSAIKESVAMEALMGHKSEQQIASDYQISPELVRQWKQQAMEGISGAFRKGVKTREKELEEQLVLLRNALCKREIEEEWLTKKQGAGTVEQRAQLLDKKHATLPRAQQCCLLGVSRTGSYYKARPKRDEKALREAVKELNEKDPCLGWSKLSFLLSRDYGIKVGRTKIERIRKELGLRTIYRHPATSTPSRKREEGKYKYRLKELDTIKVDDVWTRDITYLQMERRNYYMCCVMDWESREILGWSFSERMEVTLCLEALEMALESGRCPKIFNTDQGSQYTSREWIERLKRRDILISMDGNGRWADNIHKERFRAP